MYQKRSPASTRGKDGGMEHTFPRDPHEGSNYAMTSLCTLPRMFFAHLSVCPLRPKCRIEPSVCRQEAMTLSHSSDKVSSTVSNQTQDSGDCTFQKPGIHSHHHYHQLVMTSGLLICSCDKGEVEGGIGSPPPRKVTVLLSVYNPIS